MTKNKQKLPFRTAQILNVLLLDESQNPKKDKNIREIATEIDIIYPNILSVINRMEYRDGLITTAKRIARMRIIQLTDKGRKIAQEMNQ